MSSIDGSRDYDVIVLGGGVPGEQCAGALAEGGLGVAVVERGLVGGECSSWACIPSKTLLRPGEAVQGASEAAASAQVDVEVALAWRDFMVSDYSDAGQERWLADRGIDLLRGCGRLAGHGVVEVEGVRYAAEHVVVATGSDPFVPPVPGPGDLEGVWSTREATGMKAVPHRLLVLGGGPAGVELAQVLSRLGGQAVFVEASERVLAREPAPLGEALGEVTAARSAAITSSWQQGVARATAVSGLRRSASTPAPTGSQLTRICASATAALSAVSKIATYTHALAESNGFLTLVSDGERVTGAYALGPEAGEWLQQATLAIRARVPLEVMNDTIQPFPSFSEIFATALKALRREISYGRQPVGQEPGGAATVSR